MQPIVIDHVVGDKRVRCVNRGPVSQIIFPAMAGFVNSTVVCSSPTRGLDLHWIFDSNMEVSKVRSCIFFFRLILLKADEYYLGLLLSMLWIEGTRPSSLVAQT